MVSKGHFSTEDLLRQLTPQVLSVLIRRYGDFHAAEDAVQEALIAASLQWTQVGIPDNPRAWLVHVAGRRMQDHIRSEMARRQREEAAFRDEYAFTHQLPESVPPMDDLDLPHDQDDTLILLCMCCHPALTKTSAIALTLRAVGGLTTDEIARAYMVPQSTMAQRITRAKQRIRDAGIRFGMPGKEELRSRLDSIMHVLYLIFNEGYATSSAGVQLQRADLTREAIRLTRILHRLISDVAEVSGLLSLMLLTDARRDARIGKKGELVPLNEQDRSRWDQRMIAEGVRIIDKALSKGEVGPYQLQAAIAMLHNVAPDPKKTDWPQIGILYGLLKRMSDNPIVTLNHAVAVAMVEGAEVGLSMLKNLEADPRVADHHRLAAAKAHLLEMMGEFEQAAHYYYRAAELTRNFLEKTYLLARAERCGK